MSKTDINKGFRKVKKISNTQFLGKKKTPTITVSPKKYNIRVKKLTELNQSINIDETKINQNIKKQKNNDDVILISDDGDDEGGNDVKAPCSKNKMDSAQRMFQKKKSFNNSDSDFEVTSPSKNEKAKATAVKTTKKKSLRTDAAAKKTPSIRKLTINTNLKKFSFKNQPANQKSIKNFFTVHPKNKISYFDTFQESYQLMDSRTLKVENYLNSGVPREFLRAVDENICITDSDNDAKKTNIKNLKIMVRKELFPLKNLSVNVIKKKCKTESPLSMSSTSKAITNISEDGIMIVSDDSDNNIIQNPVEQNKPKKSPVEKYKKSINVKMTTRGARKHKSIECPSYKIVEDTSFAVDAFRFGDIKGITHYFLTHFHGDHYIGLTRKFSKPIYMSEITARLVDSFIRVNKKYINIIKLNETIELKSNGISFEITPVDANHCPGAIMLLFKNTESNKCCLHTGDFRASFNMESEPIFWNNKIDSIYLDTTYLNRNYAFKDQTDSLDELEDIIEKFREKHIGKKILYVCGSYVIGKEKVWKKIADIIGGFVYVTRNRKKALEAVNDYDLLKILVEDPKNADIHVVPLTDVSFLKLKEYFEEFEDNFDILLAIRPSGWERNSKPTYAGRINVVGIEYSEHSSYSELRRFVRFLQPKTIISTVPNRDYSKTPSVPVSWFDNRVKPKQYGFQKSITTFLKFMSKQTSDDSLNEILDATLSTTDSSKLFNNVMNKKSENEQLNFID